MQCGGAEGGGQGGAGRAVLGPVGGAILSPALDAEEPKSFRELELEYDV